MRHALTALTASVLSVASSIALAQATAPGTTPAVPGGAPATTDGTGDMNWLWLIIGAALIAAAIWYFMKRRGGTTRL